MKDVGFGWLLTAVAFGIFAIGAVLTIDRDGFSLRNFSMVVELGLAIYMAALLVGGWMAAPPK